MLGQVVTPHKSFPTLSTHKALLSSVSPQVPLKLIRACEALAAEQPVADEGPLTRVPPQVRLKVRGLAVHLSTAGDVADVLLLPPWLLNPTGGLAVGTSTSPASPGCGHGSLSVQQGSNLSLVLSKV